MGFGEELVAVLDSEDVEVLPPFDAGPSGFDDVDVLSERGLLRLIRANRMRVSVLESVELRAVARLSALRGDGRSTVSELSLSLSETENYMRNKAALAQALTTRLPRTLDALESGLITAHKASKIADSTDVLSDDLAREVDERMRDRLAGKNPGAFRQAVVRQILHVDPDGAEERRQQRRAQRKVELMPGPDGVTTLVADLPTEVAVAAYTRIDRAARALRGRDEPRTMDQLRTDVLIDLLLGDSNSSVAPRAEIVVHAAATTLAGLDDLPGEMEGHGPIIAHLARRLALSEHAVLRRVVTDPRTGTVTDVGRTRYRPTAALDDLIRVRDRHCRMPGCHRAAHHGDLDHVTPYGKGGTTGATNLIGLCRNQHRLKDHPGWNYTTGDLGTLVVTTPTGARHVGEPRALYPRARERMPTIAHPTEPSPPCAQSTE